VQRANRFSSAFCHRHVVLPVIHVQCREQAVRNATMAREAGADGVFLINHGITFGQLLEVHNAVEDAHRDWWIGVNCLDLDPEVVFARVSSLVAGVWVDNAMIREDQEDQPAAQAVLDSQRRNGWKGLYFGGVAFKYQRPVDDLRTAVVLARNYMDVVTTSGPGTGKPAHVEKIHTMKAALGDFALAIASGITPENVTDYLPFSDCYLVASGISRTFNELDPLMVKRLLDTVRSYDGQRRQR